jgi:hypothetical protein
MIAPEDQYKIAFIIEWGVFVWLVMPFELKNTPPTYQRTINMAFKEYLGVFMKLFLDDFNIFSDLKTRMVKLQLCFDKCQEFGINLNLNKCIFLVFSSFIFNYIMSEEGKLSNPKITAIVNMSELKNPQGSSSF